MGGNEAVSGEGSRERSFFFFLRWEKILWASGNDRKIEEKWEQVQLHQYGYVGADGACPWT